MKKNNLLTKIIASFVLAISIFTSFASTANATGITINNSKAGTPNTNDSIPGWSLLNGYVNANLTSSQEAAFRSNVIRTAASQKGVPYLFSTAIAGVGFDCSGLVAWSYYKQNVSMYRSAAMMRTSIRTISASQVKPGDLVFSGKTSTGAPTHVGIVADPKAKTFWNATAPGGSVQLTSYAGSWFNGSTFGTIITHVADPAGTVTSAPTTTTTSKPTTTTTTSKPTVYTRRVLPGITLNVRSAASATSTKVGSLKALTVVSGTISGGWMHITSGTYAGRYVSATYLGYGS